MPKGYRKAIYFNRKEAESLSRLWEAKARETNMAGSHYAAEELTPDKWVVQHYVLNNIVRTYVRNGTLDCDSDPHYLEGYIHNGD